MAARSELGNAQRLLQEFKAQDGAYSGRKRGKTAYADRGR